MNNCHAGLVRGGCRLADSDEAPTPATLSHSQQSSAVFATPESGVTSAGPLANLRLHFEHRTGNRFLETKHKLKGHPLMVIL